MVDHETHWARTPGLININGHRPITLHNLTMNMDTLQCSCGWIGPTRPQRTAERQLTRDWRNHAGDIATGHQITHGTPGTGCYCYRCGLAYRAAAGDKDAAASLTANKTTETGDNQ